MTDYATFLQTKHNRYRGAGKEIDPGSVASSLFPFQRDIVVWALKKGRSAVFADTGLGKTLIQLEWAQKIGGRGLIVAPLSVAHQTVRIGKQFGYGVCYVRHASEMGDGINITNYEMVEHCNTPLDWVVLDESSILKALDGKTRRKLTEMYSETPFKLCCTATPAPNDRSEIGNHAEFLGIRTHAEMLAQFFVHDEQDWRLKGHASRAFYEWLASWSMSIRLPSDLGYDDDGFVLPPLKIEAIYTESDYVPDGELFFAGLKGLGGRIEARRETMSDRVRRSAEIVNAGNGQWIVWCGMNDESRMVSDLIPDSVEVVGNDAPEDKARAFEDFQDGKVRVLVTKPKIGGFGMNFQNAHNMVFVGLSDSWESYYQCIRRCYRFGQKQPVNVYIVLSEIESEIYRNVLQKEEVAKQMHQELIEHVREFEMKEISGNEHTLETETRDDSGVTFHAMLGDSCERLKEIAESSIDLSVYSPPFANLYTYSDKAQDLGNAHNNTEFLEHYGFIVRELLRVTKPGRLTAVHVADIPAMQVKDGYIGMKDFPGDVIRLYTANGWIFRGRVTIDKDPQAQAIRTKSKALLFVQMEKDSSWSRPAIGDQILLFAKPGENAVPIRPVENGELTREDWISWARPVWYGISESDTLQYTTARDPEDERHICPLQLGTIERCIKLWSNPGETVLTPFGGIGSEGYQAITSRRKAVLIELKPSYYRIAVQNLRTAEKMLDQGTLFEEST